MPTTLTLTAINLDCPDPMALAVFYQKATGLALHPKPEFQPGGDRWRVFTDPTGHPFCVSTH